MPRRAPLTMTIGSWFAALTVVLALVLGLQYLTTLKASLEGRAAQANGSGGVALPLLR